VTEKLPAISISALRPPHTTLTATTTHSSPTSTPHGSDIIPTRAHAGEFIQTLARNAPSPQPGAEGHVCDVLPG
jgi:hypothetical protein